MNYLFRRERPNRANVTTEPYNLMRQLFDWDPFVQIAPMQTDEKATFAPGFEVKESGGNYIFKADLPGVKESDLDISLTGNRLTIAGKREHEERHENDTYYAYERSFGSFSRSFTLPEGVDGEHIAAELKDGVLTVHLPKRPELQTKKVEIKGLGAKTGNQA